MEAIPSGRGLVGLLYGKSRGSPEKKSRDEGKAFVF